MMSRSAIRRQRSGKSAPLPFGRVISDKETNNIASSVVVNKVRWERIWILIVILFFSIVFFFFFFWLFAWHIFLRVFFALRTYVVQIFNFLDTDQITNLYLLFLSYLFQNIDSINDINRSKSHNNDDGCVGVGIEVEMVCIFFIFFY